MIKRYIPKGETFLLTYGDGVSTIDIDATIREHKAKGRICTISAVHPSGRFGALTLENDGAIHTFDEKPQSESTYINGGYMYSPIPLRIFQHFGVLNKSATTWLTIIFP